MSASATRAGRGAGDAGPRRLILRALFAILILVPVGFLFTSVSGSAGDDIVLSTKERQGLEYLAVLGPMTTALATAQSDAVAGRTTAAGALAKASATVDAVDARLGADLGAHERWVDLRSKLGKLTSANPPRGEAAYTSYTEVVDLLLALYENVRATSGLVREPAIDANLLHRALAEDLPRATVAIARLTDLASLAPRRPDQTLATGQVIAARDAVLRFGDQVVNDLHDAVANTESPTLSASLFTPIDQFRLAMDTAARSTALGETTLDQLNVGLIAQSRAKLTDAVTVLYRTVHDQLDTIIAQRIDDAAARRRLAAGAGGLAALLAVLPALLSLRPRGRRRPSPAGPGVNEAELAQPDQIWGQPARPAAPSWEHSGAVR